MPNYASHTDFFSSFFILSLFLFIFIYFLFATDARHSRVDSFIEEQFIAWRQQESGVFHRESFSFYQTYSTGSPFPSVKHIPHGVFFLLAKIFHRESFSFYQTYSTGSPFSSIKHISQVVRFLPKNRPQEVHFL